MGQKTSRNAVTFGFVLLVLFAATVLLANYSGILPGGRSCRTGVCPAGLKRATCDMMTPASAGAENSKTTACPLGLAKPCCPMATQAADDARACPPDCTMPCCAKSSDCPAEAECPGVGSASCPSAN